MEFRLREDWGFGVAFQAVVSVRAHWTRGRCPRLGLAGPSARRRTAHFLTFPPAIWEAWALLPASDLMRL